MWRRIIRGEASATLLSAAAGQLLSERLVLELAAALVVGLSVLLGGIPLLLDLALIVQDRVSGLLISVGGVVDQRSEGFLEALRHTTPGLIDGTLSGVEPVLFYPTPYLSGFSGRQLGL